MVIVGRWKQWDDGYNGPMGYNGPAPASGLRTTPLTPGALPAVGVTCNILTMYKQCEMYTVYADNTLNPCLDMLVVVTPSNMTCNTHLLHPKTICYPLHNFDNRKGRFEKSRYQR